MNIEDNNIVTGPDGINVVINDNFEISPAFGLNPTIVKCFWCGEDINVRLMGRIRNDICDDVLAPDHMIFDYKPCPKCKELFSKGCTCVEVTNAPNANAYVSFPNTECYPTGSYTIIDKDFAEKIFKTNKPMVFIDSEDYRKIFKKEDQKNESE